MAGVLLLISGGLCWSSTDNSSADSVSQPRLTIYLPRDVAVESDTLTLGKIAVITGEETLVSKAGDIELGRISAAGQIITIDRSLILSRLACSGMPACNPVLSGAEKVSVRRTATVIKASSIVESASSFLSRFSQRAVNRKVGAGKNAGRCYLARSKLKISNWLPRLVSRDTNGQAVIEVSIVAGGKQIETRQVIFRPKYNIRRAVTVTDVKEGDVLTADNTKIEDCLSDAPEPTNWSTPYGLVATRNLPAGTVVGSNMAKSPQPPVVIERNQNVIIRIERARSCCDRDGQGHTAGQTWRVHKSKE